MEEPIQLPENKPSINGKFKTKEAIKTAIYKIFKKHNIEGRYEDDNWKGIQKLQMALNHNDIQFSLLDANYEGHGESLGSSLPARKVYRFEIHVRDRDGKNIILYLKVTCAFVGKTGTMADKEYELTYYFF